MLCKDIYRIYKLQYGGQTESVLIRCNLAVQSDIESCCFPGMFDCCEDFFSRKKSFRRKLFFSENDTFKPVIVFIVKCNILKVFWKKIACYPATAKAGAAPPS